jgi:hypothetical protein
LTRRHRNLSTLAIESHSFFVKAEKYSMLWIFHIFPIHGLLCSIYSVHGLLFDLKNYVLIVLIIKSNASGMGIKV